MKALEQKAKQFKGVSRNQLARQATIDYINDTRLQAIESELSEIRIEIDKLRDNLASAIMTVLLKGGKITDIKEAQSWVAKIFY